MLIYILLIRPFFHVDTFSLGGFHIFKIWGFCINICAFLKNLHFLHFIVLILDLRQLHRSFMHAKYSGTYIAASGSATVISLFHCNLLWRRIVISHSPTVSLRCPLPEHHPAVWCNAPVDSTFWGEIGSFRFEFALCAIGEKRSNRRSTSLGILFNLQGHIFHFHSFIYSVEMRENHSEEENLWGWVHQESQKISQGLKPGPRDFNTIGE